MHKNEKPGFAMMLVLILLAVGVVLGFSYVSVASLKVNVAANYQSLSRARYLAESGLQHALLTLRSNPGMLSGVKSGPFHADGTSDCYYIWARELVGSSGCYEVTARAVVGQASRTSSVVVRRRIAPVVELRHGAMVGGGGFTWLPWGLTLNGDIHVNGTLFNMASIAGDASATGGINDPWWRISGYVQGGASPQQRPDVAIRQYADTYSLGGLDYRVTEYLKKDMKRDDPLAAGGAVTADNMGGVVYLKPGDGNTVKLKDDLNFTGTLMINGNLILDGRNITVTAVEGFPALVVTGDIFVTGSARNVAINGVVVVGRAIRPAGETKDTSTTINGALISPMDGYDSSLGGKHVLNHDRELSNLYDMTLAPEQRLPTVIVLEWND